MYVENQSRRQQRSKKWCREIGIEVGSFERRQRGLCASYSAIAPLQMSVGAVTSAADTEWPKRIKVEIVYRPPQLERLGT